MADIKVLDIDKDHTVRMYEEDGINWFCAADICKCLGIKTGANNITKKIEEQYKKLVNTDGKDLVFITEEKARLAIEASRARHSKEMKDLLFRFIASSKVPKVKKPKKKVDVSEETDDEPAESTQEVNAFFEARKKPTSPISLPNPLSEPDKTSGETSVVKASEMLPSYVSCFMANPEIAKLYIEKEAMIQRMKVENDEANRREQAEFNRLKLDKEHEIKIKHLETEKLKILKNENIRTLEYWQFMNKNLFQSEWLSKADKERILEQQKYIGDRLLSSMMSIEPCERERLRPYYPVNDEL